MYRLGALDFGVPAVLEAGSEVRCGCGELCVCTKKVTIDRHFNFAIDYLHRTKWILSVSNVNTEYFKETYIINTKYLSLAAILLGPEW